jgi:hypothetical protein
VVAARIAVIQALAFRAAATVVAYLVLIVSGLFRPVVAVVGYLAIALYYIIPFRRLSAGFVPHGRRRKRVRREG